MSDRNDDDMVGSAKDWLAGFGQPSEPDEPANESTSEELPTPSGRRRSRRRPLPPDSRLPVPNSTRDRLRSELGREPTEDELAFESATQDELAFESKAVDHPEGQQRRVWLLLVGLALVIVTPFLFGYVNRLAAEGRPDHWVLARGTVVALSRVGGQNPDWETQIRFVAGRELIFFDSKYGSSGTQIGDLVAVYYDPADPDGTAETDPDRQGRTDVVLARMLVSVVFIAGVGLLVRWWKAGRGKPSTP